MAHVKKKVGRHEILFSRQRKRFCVKFVSREKKLVRKKKFWILTTCNFPTTFQYWKLYVKKGFKKCPNLLNCFLFFSAQSLKTKDFQYCSIGCQALFMSTLKFLQVTVDTENKITV